MHATHSAHLLFRTVVALSTLPLSCRSPASDAVPTPASPVTSAVSSSPVSLAPVASASTTATSRAIDSACDTETADGHIPTFPRGFAIRGIDASTEVEWATVKRADIKFAILQASLGNSANPAFAKGWQMAKACGVARGAYHLLSPKTDADAQADLFVARWQDDLGDLPPVVDVELPPGCHGPCCEVSCEDWKSLVSRVLTRVEVKGGVRPLVYAVEPFWKECLCNTSRFADHALWLAGYPRFDVAPRPGFGGWQKWAFYQAAGNARLGRGVVDTDVFQGDLGAFGEMLSGGGKGNARGGDAGR